MNEIDAQVIALVGRFVATIVALAFGALFVRWGTKLYLTGVRGKSGSIKTVLKDAQFILSNGAPGTFLSTGGVIVMVTALMTMPGYDQGRVAGALPKHTDSNPVQQQLRSPVLAAAIEPAGDTLADLTASASMPVQDVDAPGSAVRRRVPRATATPQLALNPKSEEVDTISGFIEPANIALYLSAWATARSRVGTPTSNLSWVVGNGDEADYYRLTSSSLFSQAVEQPWCPPSPTSQISAFGLSSYGVVTAYDSGVALRFQSTSLGSDTLPRWLIPSLLTDSVP
jgi:hypothetical protein